MKKILFLAALLLPLSTSAEEPTLRINEIAWMGTTTSASDEWIELYSSADGDIDLTGWLLESTDGSPAIQLEGSVPAGAYFLLERTDDQSAPEATADQIYTGSLANTGEWFKLYDAEGNLVDEVNAAEGWPAGDNTTKQTMERSSASSWQTSLEPGGTPKAENSAVLPPDEDDGAGDGDEEDNQEPPTNVPPAENARTVKKGDVLINEVFPNPAGDDLENEFIEIKNVSDADIEVTNWKITNRAKQNFIIPSFKMTPGSILVFYRHQTNLALNNSREKITLYAENGRIVDRVEYNKQAPEDESYQRQEKNKFIWGELSPGEDTVFKVEILPVAVIDGPKKTKPGEIISLDASDSFDPENRSLEYFWDFGDGRTDTGVLARQIYTAAGNYTISLKVVAGDTASSTEKLKISITGEVKKEDKPGAPTSTPEVVPLTEIPFVFIAEFLPNPEGPDSDGEFIEIFNQENQPINLAGWKLDDAEGGSKPYIFPAGTIIKPLEYKAFYRTETKLALNNSDEEVRFFAPDGTLVDYASYEESKEGSSFVLDENFIWQETSTPTPGEINALNVIEEKKVEPNKEPKILGAKTEEKIAEGEPKNKARYIISAASAILVLGAGTILKVKKKI